VPRRLLAPLAALLALTIGAGCADDVSPALRVGDATIGNAEFLDELAEWTGNENAVPPEAAVAGAPGAFPGDLTRQLLTQRIDFEVHGQEFEALGLELDAADREAAVQAIFADPTQAEESLAPFSDDFADAFIDDVARQLAVQEALGEQYETWRQQAFATTTIEVNPRYGTWDAAAGSITPPAGPRPAPGGSQTPGTVPGL
jgi:hypothetical protein